MPSPAHQINSLYINHHGDISASKEHLAVDFAARVALRSLAKYHGIDIDMNTCAGRWTSTGLFSLWIVVL